MGLEELGYLGLFIAGFLAATVIPFSSESLLTIALLNGFDTFLLFNHYHIWKLAWELNNIRNWLHRKC